MITIFLTLGWNTIHLFWMRLDGMSMEQMHQYDETIQEGKVESLPNGRYYRLLYLDWPNDTLAILRCLQGLTDKLERFENEICYWKIKLIYEKNLTPMFMCKAYHEYLTFGTIKFATTFVVNIPTLWSSFVSIIQFLINQQSHGTSSLSLVIN
jgi:hypothetical protein